MRPVTSCSLLLALSLAVSSARAVQDQAPAGRGLFNGIAFPEQIGQFDAVATNRWPDNPELGTQVKYMAVGVEADVYLYPVAGDASSTDLMAAEAEYARAVNEIREYARDYRDAGKIDAVEEMAYDVTVDGGRSFQGRYARFTIVQNAMKFQSLLLVFVRDGQYVKFRISHDPAMGESQVDAMVRIFVGEVLERVRPR